MRREAFTFVEVLVSLAISALLVGTICSALIQVTQVERRTRVLRAAPFQLQTLACRIYLGRELPDDRTVWSVELQEQTIDTEQGATSWMVLQLAPVDDLTFSYTLGMREGLGSW